MCAPSKSVLSCCQICFDEVPVREPESENSSEYTKDGLLVTQLCGPQCEAQICQTCLTRHVHVSLERFYAGVVPKVRCPICLTPMHKSQWQIHLEDDKSENKTHELVQRFETLCKQACGLTAPCCHKADYSHLPVVACHSEDDDAAEVAGALMAVHPAAQEHIAPLWSLCRDFHEHKNVAARTVVEFVLQYFDGDKALDAMDQLLPRLRDDERRATLQLAYLYVRPSVWSRCCGMAFCFNCKRKEHHEVCDQGQAVDLATCLIQCRSCRAMLLKVDGCSIVSCLCGFAMDWERELRFKQWHEKKTIPVDVFDTALFEIWLRWKDQFTRFRPHMKRAYLKFRNSRMGPWMVEYKPLLIQHIGKFIWRRRFTKHVIKPLPWTLRCNQFADWIKNHQTLAHTTFVRLIWQHRFTRDVVLQLPAVVCRFRFKSWAQKQQPLVQKTLVRLVWQRRFSRTVFPQMLTTVRQKQVSSWIQTNKTLLQQTLLRMMWLRRFTRNVLPLMLTTVRRNQVDAWILAHKTLLVQTLMRLAWQKRFTKQVLGGLVEAVDVAKKSWAIKRYRSQLRGMLSNYIWRRRFTSIVESQQIYWAAYYCKHRDEAQALAEDALDLFSMDLIED